MDTILLPGKLPTRFFGSGYRQAYVKNFGSGPCYPFVRSFHSLFTFRSLSLSGDACTPLQLFPDGVVGFSHYSVNGILIHGKPTTFACPSLSHRTLPPLTSTRRNL